MDQVIEFKRIDLAGVRSAKPIPKRLEEQQELLLVIGGHRFPRHPAARPLATPVIAAVSRTAHERSVNGPTSPPGPDGPAAAVARLDPSQSRSSAFGPGDEKASVPSSARCASVSRGGGNARAGAKA